MYLKKEVQGAAVDFSFGQRCIYFTLGETGIHTGTAH